MALSASISKRKINMAISLHRNQVSPPPASSILHDWRKRSVLPKSRLFFMFAIGIVGHAFAQPVGDIIRGKEYFETICIACHEVNTIKVGPFLGGVVGRPAGSVRGFDYSEGLKNSKLVWNAETINRWLSGPNMLVPGNKMGFSVADAQARANVIAYLSTLKAPVGALVP
ncbi:c-type cytochrome [Undibacterium sp. TJN25]|uniref:c-type cytochrome n=1 Tax=Undibacterium sp. TJN25 TaxID=3413056 RepID=UPI003BF0437F